MARTAPLYDSFDILDGLRTQKKVITSAGAVTTDYILHGKLITHDDTKTTFYFSVNAEYADTTDEFRVDASLARAAVNAVSNAKAIIRTYSGAPGDEKLLGYKNVNSSLANKKACGVVLPHRRFSF